ncbi:hypothetical protein Bbelb_127360 [Branchiostoma belcheri]|nr:hypothetical protein Bbelb_127360 [Branchiostoma belcheri]
MDHCGALRVSLTPGGIICFPRTCGRIAIFVSKAFLYRQRDCRKQALPGAPVGINWIYSSLKITVKTQCASVRGIVALSGGQETTAYRRDGMEGTLRGLTMRWVLVLLVVTDCVLWESGTGRLAVSARALPTPEEQGVSPQEDVPLATVSTRPHVPITGALHPPLAHSQTETVPLSQPESHALSTPDAVGILCVATIVPILGIAFILYPCFRDGVQEWRLKWEQKKRDQQSRRQAADVNVLDCRADVSIPGNIRESSPDICDAEWAFISPRNRESLLQDVWNRSDDAALRTQRRHLNDDKGTCPSVQIQSPDTSLSHSRSELTSPLSPNFLWKSMFSYDETFRRLQPPTWRSHQPQNDATSSPDEPEHVFGFSVLEKKQRQTHEDPFKRLDSDVAYGRGVGSEKRRRQFYSVSSSVDSGGNGRRTPSPVWVRRRSVVVIENTKVDASSDYDILGERSSLRVGRNTNGSGTDTLKTILASQRNRTSSAGNNDPSAVTSSTDSVSSVHVIHVCADVHERDVSSSSSGNNVGQVATTGPSQDTVVV